MRAFVVAVASVIALSAVAAGLARLGATIAQLRELDVPLRPRSPKASDEAVRRPPAVPASAPAVVDAPERPAQGAEEPARVAIGGDAQILRWLAEDPQLARAADELLRDPDPAVQAEARAFVRELGVRLGASEER